MYDVHCTRSYKVLILQETFDIILWHVLLNPIKARPITLILWLLERFEKRPITILRLKLQIWKLHFFIFEKHLKNKFRYSDPFLAFFSTLPPYPPNFKVISLFFCNKLALTNWAMNMYFNRILILKDLFLALPPPDCTKIQTTRFYRINYRNL